MKYLTLKMSAKSWISIKTPSVLCKSLGALGKRSICIHCDEAAMKINNVFTTFVIMIIIYQVFLNKKKTLKTNAA